MPITALPDDTIRLLGSPTVITTPVDVVKELLENAIDARATSVGILVSPNTIDKIEVRDNGDGIHADCYNSLGRLGHTSKISSFEELQTLGGATLGFRGQALASANTLGNVTVTTRTAEDSTAVVLKLSPDVGGVESQQRISGLAGTTVIVTGLFSRLPVREEFAVKEAQKYLVRIKQLLHSYALARPQIRLSFRVLGENSKQAWSYAPPHGATIKTAAIQVLGTEAMSQCLIRTICGSADEDSDTVQIKEETTIQAVLPRPDADQSKVSSRASKGSFFSVDSRPVSTQRGTMKKLQTMFKTYFLRSLRSVDGQKTLKDAYICVNIRCPPGSYDQNVEPSKSEVLFAEESQLTDLFERLLSEVYKSQEPLDPLVSLANRQLFHQTQTRTPPPSNSDRDGVQSRPPAPAEDCHDQVHQVEQTPAQSSSSPIRGQTRDPFLLPNAIDGLGSRDGFQAANSYPVEPPVVSTPEREALLHHIPSEIGDAQSYHPSTLPDLAYQQTTESALTPRRWPAPDHVGNRGWVINMSADPDMSSDDETEMLASRFRIQQNADSLEDEEDADPKEGLNPWSIAKMTAPARRPDDVSAGGPCDISQTYEPQVLSIHDKAFDENLPILRPHGGPPGDLDPPRSTGLGITHREHQPDQLLGFHHGRSPGASPTAHDMPQPWSQLKPSNDRHKLPRLRFYHNDAVEDVELDSLAETRLNFGGRRGSQTTRNNQPQLHIGDVPSRSNRPFRKPKRVNAGSRGSSAMNLAENVNNVADGFDNHYLTEYGIGQMRHQSPRQVSHSGDFALGKQNNHFPERPAASPSDSLRGNDDWLGGDPRKYLMRRQRSEAEHRRKGRQPLKRSKTDKLPLESVPEKEELQQLVLNVVPDIQELEGISGDMTGDDTFCGYSRTAMDLSDEMDLNDAMEIEARLKVVLSDWTEKILGDKTEVELDIRSRVKGKGIAA